MSLFMGTSGWAYKEWKPAFYPPEVPATRFLEHYAKELPACEVNATFYRVPDKELVSRWAGQTPDDFKFSFKAHRMLTYAKEMVPSGPRRALLDDFMAAMSAAGHKIGAYLWQYPGHRQRDDAMLTELLENLPPRCALEFRHESWNAEAIAESVAQAGCTVCYSDTTGDPPPRLAPGPLAYVRMRAGSYTEDQRAGWRDLLKREAESRDVFAFIKHEGVAADDEFGGVALARWLGRAGL